MPLLQEKELSQYIVLVCMPFVAGAIGWFTNFVAVKMLLKPRNPVRFLGLKIQGLLPRRHKELAGRIASAISRDFLTEEQILEFVRKADAGEALQQYIRKKWDEKINDLLAYIPMVEMFVGPDKLDSIRDKVLEAVAGSGGEFSRFLVNSLSNKVDLEQTIRDNILAFDLGRLEKIIEDIARKEFRYIERLGGMIGFLIGLVQAVLVFLFF